MQKFGIDVSKWQGSFNFKTAKAQGVEFVILRGAYARGKDTKFEQYYKDCRAAGLPVGVYQYSMATTEAEAIAEAKYLHEKVLAGKKFEYPIYIDIEDREQLELSRTRLTNIALAWCDYLESRGYFVGIYAGVYTFRDHMNDAQLQRFTHWIPQWAKACTYAAKNCLGMWQFGGETNLLRSNKIAGVVCDQNYAYVDFESIIKKNKLNGYGAAKIEKGDSVRVKQGAKTYTGGGLAPYVYTRTHTVKQLSGDRAVIAYNGVTVAAVKLSDLIPV